MPSLLYSKYNYGDGRYLKNGYWFLYRPNYPSSDKKGCIREHIYKFQEHYKCCLLPWGVIHHKDELRSNNEISNLSGMMKRKHTSIHQKGKKPPKLDKSNRFCKTCKSDSTYMNKKGWYLWYGSDINGWLCCICYKKSKRTPKLFDNPEDASYYYSIT